MLAVMFAAAWAWAQDVIVWNGDAPVLTPGAEYGQYSVKIEAGATGTLNVDGGWHVSITSDELIDLADGKIGINFTMFTQSSPASVNWTAQVTGSATSGGVVEVTNASSATNRSFNINSGLIQSTGAGATALLSAVPVNVSNAEVKATGDGGKAIFAQVNISGTVASVTVNSGTVSATIGRAIDSYGGVFMNGGTVRVTTGTAIYIGSGNLRLSDQAALVIGQNPVLNAENGLLNRAPQAGHNAGYIISYTIGGGTHANGSTTGLQTSSTHGDVKWAMGPGGAGGISYVLGTKFIEITGVTVTIPELEWIGNPPPAVTQDSRVKINATAGGSGWLNIPANVTVIIVSDGTNEIITGGAIQISLGANARVIWEAKIDRRATFSIQPGSRVDIEDGAQIRGLTIQSGDGTVNINGGTISGSVGTGWGYVTLNVNGGVISSSATAITGSGNATINISGGTISAAPAAFNSGISLGGGKLNMSGGLVVSTHTPVSDSDGEINQTGGALVGYSTWDGMIVLEGGKRDLTITPSNANVYWTKTPSAGIRFGDLFVPIPGVTVADPIDVSDKIVFNSSSKDYTGRHLWVEPAAFDPSFSEGHDWALSYTYEVIDEAGNENASVTWRPWSMSTPGILAGYYPLTAGRYKVTVTYDDLQVTTGTKVATFTINKLVVQLEDFFPPTATEITYGEKVSDSDLEDGMTGGIWAWHNDDKDKVPGAGNPEFRAVFTPTDNDNYDWDAIGDGVFEVELTVNPKELTITGVSATNRGYEAGNVTVELTGGSLVGVVSGDNVDFILGDGTMANADAGTNKAVTTAIELIGAASGNYTLTQPAGITVNIGTTGTTAVLSSDRAVPPSPNSPGGVPKGGVVSTFAGEFTAGPNPVNKQLGSVNFFAGAPLAGARDIRGTLTIFDASGNVVNKIRIVDDGRRRDAMHCVSTTANDSRRIVGTWDLTDTRGRQVSAGTYLVRGAVTIDGKRERVSLMVGVR